MSDIVDDLRKELDVSDDDHHLRRVLTDAIAEIERLRNTIHLIPLSARLPLIQQDDIGHDKNRVVFGDSSTMIDHCFDGTNSEGLYKTQTAYNTPRLRGFND